MNTGSGQPGERGQPFTAKHPADAPTAVGKFDDNPVMGPRGRSVLITLETHVGVPMPILAPFLLSFALPSHPTAEAKPKAPAPPTFMVLRSLKAGGEGGWDYVALDSKGARI